MTKDINIFLTEYPSFQFLQNNMTDFLNESEIYKLVAELVTLIFEDISNVDYKECLNYFDSFLVKIPPKILPYFLEQFFQELGEQNAPKVILYFLRHERPIYKIKALNVIQKIQDASYTAFIIPLIYSNYVPLKQVAVSILLQIPGNSEQILEQHLFDRNQTKKEIAIKVLNHLNPQNLKLGEILLYNSDFIERINGIQILAQSKNKKYLPKIELLLRDPDIAVRNAAIDALTKIGGQKAKKILYQYLNMEEFMPLRERILLNLQNF